MHKLHNMTIHPEISIGYETKENLYKIAELY